MAYQSVLGAQRLPRFELPAGDAPPDASAWARRTAAELATDADRIATLLTRAERPVPSRRPGTPPPPEHHPALPTVVDLEVWMTDIDRQLTRIEGSVGRDA
ncbi:hypothetical protein ABZV31_19230 [Streptomyces sp. NPDC005202]|uniref:hypothetical protein n=1 Tax=Streptomyces sp. NPDC005202 TaxID=3157021 RepID=UPI0033B7D1AF